MQLNASGRSWVGNFFIIWSGQAFSLVGSALVQFALIWWLTVRTDSVTVLAIAALVSEIPFIVLSPLAGAVIDRYNRRRIMVLADGGIALTTLGLVLLSGLNRLQPWHIYAALVIRMAGMAFHIPAMSSSTTLLVPRTHLARISGLNQALDGVMAITAPPLGALLFSLLPLYGVLMIDVITAAIAIGTLVISQIPQPTVPASIHENPFKTLWSDSVSGFRYIYAWSGLFIVIVISSLLNMLFAPVSVLEPLWIKRIFDGTAYQLGVMDSAFAIGAILGGLTLSIWGGFKRRIYTSLSGLLLMSISIVVVGATPGNAFWLAVGASVVMGAMNAINKGPLTAVIQSSVEPAMQGRVFTTMSSLYRLLSPVGVILAAPVANTLGIRAWFYIGGICGILAGLVELALPGVRNIEYKRAGEGMPVISAGIPSTITTQRE